MIITCVQLVEAVTDAREGKLRVLDRVGYEAHLARCRHCRAYVAQMNDTVRGLGGCAVETPAPNELHALLRAKLTAGKC